MVNNDTEKVQGRKQPSLRPGAEEILEPQTLEHASVAFAWKWLRWQSPAVSWVGAAVWILFLQPRAGPYLPMLEQEELSSREMSSL